MPSFISSSKAVLVSALTLGSLFNGAEAAPAKCSCGYKVAALDNEYLPYAVTYDFRDYSSLSQLEAAGIIVADGFQVGSTADDGTTAWASQDNVKLASDGLHLIVPGGQAAGGQVSVAEIIFNADDVGMTKIYVEAEIQVDAKVGTCQALFTYANDNEVDSDEQDMEVIAASLLSDSDVADAGIQLTNYDPTGSGDSDFKTVPFPSDPSKGFHKYQIAWDRDTVNYAFDGEDLNGPTKYVSKNPSAVVLNHWATGQLGFFGAPLPETDVIMRVRSLKIYYETESKSPFAAKSCRLNAICQV